MGCSFWNLLAEPLIQVRSGAAIQRRSLPQVLASLSTGEDLDFVVLRPHQQPAWHAFLVALALLALEDHDGPVPDDADAWRSLLRALTSEFPDDEPWHLVVDDVQRPAFLQPPCLPGREGDYRGAAGSAQELDLLVTSKNHDEKLGKARAGADDLDAYVYALVSLQGFAAFMGAGNYNTMRMNGGFGSRPQFRLAPGGRSSGAEFSRDLQVLRADAEDLWRRAEPGNWGSRQRHALLWLLPWGDKALTPAQVHPLCLEVSRRVRLRTQADGSITVLTASSKSARVAAKAMNGSVLDPWIPLALEGEVRALTATAESFRYDRLARVLFEPGLYQLPLLAQPAGAEKFDGSGAAWVAQVVVGGSGKTDGLLRRELHMPPKVQRQFVDDRGSIALRAAQFVEAASKVQRVLRSALIAFVDGSQSPNWKNDGYARAAVPWVQQFEQGVDDRFYPELFFSIEAQRSDVQAHDAWVPWLRDLAESVFARAIEALPSGDGTRLFARAHAERVLRGGLFKQFPELRAPSTRAESRWPMSDNRTPSASTLGAPAAKDALASLAGQLASPHLDAGVLARLRRFHPVTHGGHSVFETQQLLVRAGVTPSDDSLPRWAVLIHALAIVRGAHDPFGDAGAALARLHYSEGRLRQLVEADAELLYDLLPLLARRLAAAGARINWKPLAQLLLTAGIDEAAADRARLELVRGFVKVNDSESQGANAS